MKQRKLRCKKNLLSYKTALRLLTRREHSSAELAQKLFRKNFAPEGIQATLKKLHEENFLNENRFIENFIRYKMNRGYGPLRIQAELIEKGIDEETFKKILNPNDETWFEHAYHAWRKRFKNKMPTDLKSRAQQMRFLQYRGFLQEHVRKIFKIQ